MATVREKIQKYLSKQTKPKTLAQIVAGAKVNENSARRELATMLVSHVKGIGYALRKHVGKKRAA